MTEYTRCINQTHKASLHFDFGVTDRLGRAMGAVVWTFESDFILETKFSHGWTVSPGHYFEVKYAATRNGEQRQASTNKRFATEAERAADIAKHVEAMRKRAVAPAARGRA